MNRVEEQKKREITAIPTWKWVVWKWVWNIEKSVKESQSECQWIGWKARTRRKSSVKINKNRLKMENRRKVCCLSWEMDLIQVGWWCCCCCCGCYRDKHLAMDLYLNAHLFVLRFWCILFSFFRCGCCCCSRLQELFTFVTA